MKHPIGLLAAGLALVIADCMLPAAGSAAEPARATEPAAKTDPSSAPRLDVVFCVDTTGSMADEIDVVKSKMREMIANIAVGDPTPDVRFGLVIYRDRGDEYVTKRYDLTRDIDAVVEYINSIVATGGNDYPESMNESLHVAVREMNWDLGQDVGRSIFLIADAPPHLDYEDDFDYRDEATEALGKGIIIDTIGCSGLEEKDETIFKEIAELTSGSFELLTYMREYVKADGAKGVVMSAGSELYALADVVKADEWRAGAVVLAGRGRAHRLAEGEPPDAVVGRTTTAGRAMGDTLSLGYVVDRSIVAGVPASGAASSAAAREGAERVAAVRRPDLSLGVRYKPRDLGLVAGAEVAEAIPPPTATNNLDYLLTRRVQYQLAQQGVRFADQPYLPTAEWQGGTCAQAERRAMVARSQREWAEIWSLIAEAEGREEAPRVDFSRDIVLAAFGGEKWKGRTVRIADVWAEDDGLHALVRRGADDAEATMPYHVIVVSKYEGKVIWK